MPNHQTMRLGKFAEDKKRPILVTFNSVWDARICLTKDIENKLFETNQILIVRALSGEEQDIEKAILKKRFELVQSGIDKPQLKIRNLKLYNNGQLVTLDWLAYLSAICINCQSCLSISKRSKSSDFISIHLPDIILLTETRLGNDFHERIILNQNYSTCCRRNRKSGTHGGVAIIAKNDITVKVLAQICDFLCGIGIAAKEPVTLLCVYNPPSASKDREDLALIYNHIQAILKTSSSKEMVVCGDFNLPNVTWETYSANDAETDVFLSQMIANAFDQLI